MDISSADVAGRRLMIATPMYEGLCHGAYTAALVALALRLRELDVAFTLQLLTNQSSPERARTIISNAFLRSDCTRLLFIDADVVVNPEDAVGLLALQSDTSAYDVIAGAYPRKSLDWDAIARAARRGADAGELPRYGGDSALNFGQGLRELRLDRPVEVESVGGGFTMIRRATFEQLVSAYPGLTFAPDLRERTGHGLDERVHHFFATQIDPATGALRSEDFAFCDRVRAAGMKVWLCPWMHADHIGNHRFSGTLADALRLNNDALSVS